MVLCISLIVVYYLLPDEIVSPITAYNPVFWLESIAVFVFGVSWLTKGGGILADKAAT